MVEPILADCVGICANRAVVADEPGLIDVRVEKVAVSRRADCTAFRNMMQYGRDCLLLAVQVGGTEEI